MVGFADPTEKDYGLLAVRTKDVPDIVLLTFDQVLHVYLGSRTALCLDNMTATPSYVWYTKRIRGL